jgi:hypothetical protein
LLSIARRARDLGSASAPTAEHPRRRPQMAGDRAGKQNRQFIGALVERFRHFSDLVLDLVAFACLTAVPVAVTTVGAVALTRLWQTLR